jgi:hypothetical protein
MDSQVFDDIIDPENADPQVRADSAYRSEATEAALCGAGYESHICEKDRRVVLQKWMLSQLRTVKSNLYKCSYPHQEHYRFMIQF